MIDEVTVDRSSAFVLECLYRRLGIGFWMLGDPEVVPIFGDGVEKNVGMKDDADVIGVSEEVGHGCRGDGERDVRWGRLDGGFHGLCEGVGGLYCLFRSGAGWVPVDGLSR